MILITGSSGYIAKNLSSELSKLDINHKLVSRTADNNNNLKLSFKRDTNWLPLLKDVDTLVHLAGIAHKKSTLNKHKEFYESTINLFEQSIVIGVKKIIFLSTVGVMGEGRSVAYNIYDKPKPANPYTKYKLKTENILIDMCLNNDTKYTIIRSPLVYGSGSPGNLRRMISILKLSIPLPFLGLSKKISIVSISNLVDFLICCLKNKKSNNQRFYISDDKDIQIKDLMLIIIKNFSLSTRLFYINLNILKFLFFIFGFRNYFSKLNNPITIDISETKKIMNWSPKEKNNQGLNKILREVYEKSV